MWDVQHCTSQGCVDISSVAKYPHLYSTCFTMVYLKAQEIWMTKCSATKIIQVYHTFILYMIYMFCIVARCFVVLGVEAFVGSISLPVHRFSTATGDSTTTRTRCWQFYFSRSRPGIHASKTIIEYHRSIAVLEASGTRCFKGCGPSSLWSSRDSWEL